MILTRPRAAGDVVDLMTDGDIVDLVDAELLAASVLAAGKAFYADLSATTGQLVEKSGKAAGDYYVGRTFEMNAATGKARLVVRCSFIAEA